MNCERPHSGSKNPETLSANKQKNLEAEADKILARAGYRADGQVKSAKRESLRAISIPCGGKPGYKRR